MNYNLYLQLQIVMKRLVTLLLVAVAIAMFVLPSEGNLYPDKDIPVS